MLKRIDIRLVLIMIILLIVINISGCKSEKSVSPNIVIIFTDDQGYADLGVYGREDIKTPNIDQLAQEGIQFTNFYVSEAVSTSSRASLLTGCLAQRIGLSGTALTPGSRKGLNTNEQTIASLLKQKNYKTAIYGKWHLGSVNEFFPHNYGFDEYFGLPYSNDMWPYTYEGNPVSEGHKSKFPPLYLHEDTIPGTEINSLEKQGQLTRKYTQRAVQFIKENIDNPFFLYVPHSMPHTPIAASPEFKGSSQQGPYGDVIQEIDWSVGEIMKTLKESGIDKNTLVIYVSDNGPWMNFGEYAGSAFPLREGKGSMWEGGCRVPCVMRWPEKIPSGIINDKIAATIDLLPTIAELSQTQISDNEIDGTSILPYLSGDDSKEIRDHYAYYYGGQLRAVRKGKWKLYFPHTYRSYKDVEPGTNGNPGPYSYKICDIELYDLRDDVEETRILTEQFPEIVEELNQLADSFRIILGDRLTGQIGTNKREPGRLGYHLEKVSHKAVTSTIKLLTPLNPKYTAGGAKALVDGYTGSLDFTDDRWLGFQGDDFISIIDLGERDSISEIRCHFLQNQGSWIFLPTSLIIETSDDGQNFEEIYNESFNSDQASKQTKIESMGYNDSAAKARFIRISATNIGSCPDWHTAKGENAWLFVDEIIVK